MRRPPTGWTKEEVAARLAAGEPAPAIIDGFMGHSKKSRSAFAADLGKWRLDDPSFAALIGKADTPGGGQPVAEPPQLLEVLIGAFAALLPWQQDCLRTYGRTKSKLSAVLATHLPDGSPLSMTYLNRRIIPGAPEFDQALADAFDEVEAIFVAEAEDRIWRELDLSHQTAVLSGDARTALWGNLEVLARRGKRQGWQKSEDRVISGTVNHNHTHVLEQAAIAAGEHSRQMFAGRPELKLLPAGAPS